MKKSVKRKIYIFVALSIALTFGVFQAARWVWREIPAMRIIVLPIIIQSSKSWLGSGDDQIIQKLGIPISRVGSITMIAGDKGIDFYYMTVRIDRPSSERNPNGFENLVNRYCQENLSSEQKILLLRSMEKIGNIQDFRNHFQKIRSVHEFLILEEKWTYDVGEGKFDRAIRLIFDDSRNLKSLVTFWKDGK